MTTPVERFEPALHTSQPMVTVRRLYSNGSTATQVFPTDKVEAELEYNQKFFPDCSVWVSDGRGWVQHGISVSAQQEIEIVRRWTFQDTPPTNTV